MPGPEGVGGGRRSPSANKRLQCVWLDAPRAGPPVPSPRNRRRSLSAPVVATNVRRIAPILTCAESPSPPYALVRRTSCSHSLVPPMRQALKSW